MMPSRGMGASVPPRCPKPKRSPARMIRDKVKVFKAGGKSRVNEAGNYTKPGMRKAIFERIKAGGKGGAPGQWSARKAQMLAQQYKKSGGLKALNIKIESPSGKV
jgi:ABC-type transport system substrate-binding protein